MPLVSVILNVLNGAATLADAVDSVLSQTFDDWELIVWDDCSTDNSAELLSHYGDERIRYVRAEQQLPLGQARQRAIDRPNHVQFAQEVPGQQQRPDLAARAMRVE